MERALPPKYKRVLEVVVSIVTRDGLPLVAAGVAFFATLAVFPAIAAIVALYGALADPSDILQHSAMLQEFMPQEVYDQLRMQLGLQLARDESRHGFALFAWIALGLWLARAGVNALITGLDQVNPHAKPRGFIDRFVCSLALTVGLIFASVLALISVVIAPIVLAFLPLGPVAELALDLLRWTVALMTIMWGFAAIYRFGPSRLEEARSFKITYGIVIATVLWMLGSAGFSYYLSHFANYNQVYGSFGAVIALIMWLYLSAYAALLGAMIDMELTQGRIRRRADPGPGPDLSQ